MKKKFAVLIAVLTIAVVGCGSTSYKFVPDSTPSGTGSDPIEGCGIVQRKDVGFWEVKTNNLGRACMETTTTTEGS